MPTPACLIKEKSFHYVFIEEFIFLLAEFRPGLIFLPVKNYWGKKDGVYGRNYYTVKVTIQYFYECVICPIA